MGRPSLFVPARLGSDFFLPLPVFCLNLAWCVSPILILTTFSKDKLSMYCSLENYIFCLVNLLKWNLRRLGIKSHYLLLSLVTRTVLKIQAIASFIILCIFALAPHQEKFP